MAVKFFPGPLRPYEKDLPIFEAVEPFGCFTGILDIPPYISPWPDTWDQLGVEYREIVDFLADELDTCRCAVISQLVNLGLRALNEEYDRQLAPFRATETEVPGHE